MGLVNSPATAQGSVSSPRSLSVKPSPRASSAIYTQECMHFLSKAQPISHHYSPTMSTSSSFDYPLKPEYKLLDNKQWYRETDTLPTPELQSEDDRMATVRAHHYRSLQATLLIVRQFSWGLKFMMAALLPPLLAFVSDYNEPHIPNPFPFSKLLIPTTLLHGDLSLGLGSMELWYLLSFSTFVSHCVACGS